MWIYGEFATKVVSISKNEQERSKYKNNNVINIINIKKHFFIQIIERKYKCYLFLIKIISFSCTILLLWAGVKPINKMRRVKKMNK